MQKDLKKMLTLSLLLHLIIILPVFLFSMKGSTLIIYSPVYSVDLVAPLHGRKAGGKEKGSGLATLKRIKERKRNSARRKREAEKLRKKLAALKKIRALEEKQAMEALHARVEALKAKKSGKIVKKRLAEIERKQRERENTEKLIRNMQQKIAALKQSVNERGKNERDEKSRGTARERVTTGGKGTLDMPPEIKAYLNDLDQKVRGAWTVPRVLIGNRSDLMVQLRIIIEENGGVSSIIVERPSGERPFDESVLRAIKKASPLPTPPEILREGKDYFEVGFRFHYFKEGE